MRQGRLVRAVAAVLAGVLLLAMPAMAFASDYGYEYDYGTGSGGAEAGMAVAALVIWGIAMAVGLALFALFVWMAIVMFQMTEQEYAALGTKKNTWLISGILSFFLGLNGIWAIVFYFVVHKKRKAMAGMPPVPQPGYAPVSPAGFPPAPPAPTAPPAPPAPPTGF